MAEVNNTNATSNAAAGAGEANNAAVANNTAGEANNAAVANTTGVGTGNASEPDSPSVSELIAQLAAANAANEKNKAAIDKLTKENGNLTKSLRARQTAEELDAEAKKEQEEQRQAYIAELETFKKTSEAKERYAMQGMSAELAAKAAEAEISGDMDALSNIQKQYTNQLIKAEQEKWLRQRPQPQSGDGYEAMTKEQIMAITDRAKRREAIARNMNAFK